MLTVLVKGGFFCSPKAILLFQMLHMKTSEVGEDGSLTMQDPLWMMVGATVGLL